MGKLQIHRPKGSDETPFQPPSRPFAPATAVRRTVQDPAAASQVAPQRAAQAKLDLGPVGDKDEQEADRVGPVGATPLSQATLQRKPREAMVDWQVTHLVRDQGDSLFGDDSEDGWRAGELPVEEGELTRGQRILVDDEVIFMSRRGSNQENRERRLGDSTKELKHKWYLVLGVEARDYSTEGVYIRSETIRLAEEPRGEQSPVDVVEIPEARALGPQVSGRLTEIRDAWTHAALKRRRSVNQVKYKGADAADLPDDLSSGWNWDQYDEGEDVAEGMSDPGKREYIKPNQPTNFTLTATYRDDEFATPIAFIVLEMNTKENRLFADDFAYEPPEENFFYIRWLVGHPTLKGGGSALMHVAKQKSFALQRAIYVQVAYSAIEWYEKMGFEVAEEGEYREGEGYGDTLLKYTPPPPLRD
jgi:hypothetical protein